MTAIFYTILEKENDTGEIDHIPMLKTFVVFNVEQIDGLSLTADTVAPQATFDALPQAENLFCNRNKEFFKVAIIFHYGKLNMAF